jgi:hypothetical protein
MPHAKIATNQAKYTLEQLHAELAGKIRVKPHLTETVSGSS